jgi:hypothetical protein
VLCSRPLTQLAHMRGQLSSRPAPCKGAAFALAAQSLPTPPQPHAFSVHNPSASNLEPRALPALPWADLPGAFGAKNSRRLVASGASSGWCYRRAVRSASRRRCEGDAGVMGCVRAPSSGG